MNVLINFSTLKAGGGQNVAMNFLYELNKMKINDINFFYFVAEDSEPYRFLKNKNDSNFIVVSNNPFKRMVFEKFKSKKILDQWNIDIIYTYFGYGIFPKKYLQVSGVAVSNIFFPEIKFWSEYPFHKRIIKKLVDLYRIYGVKHSDALIFENKAMERRCREFKWNYNTTFIKPSIIDYKNIKCDKNINWDFVNVNEQKGLFLCGWHLNKNLLIIPKIAKVLQDKKIKYKFIITAGRNEENFIYKKFMKLVNKYEVNSYIEIIEPVKKNQLKFLYENIDHVFLLSKLESFSNNIIESWFFEKPLIITDALWSREICNKAALYVNRDDEEDIAENIINLMKDKQLQKKLIMEGKKELNTYPDIKEKTLSEINFIRKLYEEKN